MPTASFPEFKELFSNQPETLLLLGEFTTEATPSRTAGKGFVPTKTAAGRWRVTLNKKQPRFVTAFHSIAELVGTAEAVFPGKHIIFDPANGYVEFKTVNASGVLADPLTTSRIGFLIVCMRVKLPLT